MSRKRRLTFTKLVDEDFYIDASHKLRDLDNDASHTITSITTAWMEKRVSTNPETWAEVDGLEFSSLQILRSGTMVGGIVDKDADTDPAPGDGYRVMVECEKTATAEYGGQASGVLLSFDCTIDYNATTAPAA